MQLRRFNDQGVKTFAIYLDTLRANPTTPVPESLLNDPKLTQPLDPPIEAEPQTFNTRMDFVCWLYDAAKEAGANVPRRDAGFWAWLTLALFDQVCPKNNRGDRTLREFAWYIPVLEDGRRHYRHILYGSYTIFHIYRDKPETAYILLVNKLTILGHFWYQLASRQDLVSNPAVVGAATKLYLDTVNMRHKPRSVTQVPGAIFRFVKLMNQLDRVWDLRMQGTKGILDVLPQEFTPFLSR